MSPLIFDRFMVAVELGSSAKVGRLKDSEFRCLITGVWALAAKATPRGYLAVAGTPADEHDVARQAHQPVSVARSTLSKLRRMEMLEHVDDSGLEYCHNWHLLNPDPRRDETAAERQRRKRERDSHGNGHGDVTRDSHGNVTVEIVTVTAPEVEVEVEVEEEQRLNDENSTVEQGSTGVGRRVFDAWVISTGRTTQTAFDAKRQRIIANALKTYPVEDVLDAVDGWRFSAHHRGENTNARVYNDLGLLLRDADHIEMFRDLKRGAEHLNGQRDGISELDRERLAAVNRITKGEELP